jgi:F-type H+-transporting ATPase subunit epsilon
MATEQPNNLAVEILSPEKVLFKGAVSGVSVPAKLGYMLVLPGHAPLVAELGIGELSLISKDQTIEKFFIAGGFIEVNQTSARVLVDVIEKPKDIDADRAKKAMQRAEKRLSEKSKEEIDYARALAALKRAQGRAAMSIILRQ